MTWAHRLPNTAFLTTIVNDNTPNRHILHGKGVYRGMNGYFEWKMAIFAGFVRILSAMISYPIFGLSYPLVGPNTQPHPFQHLLEHYFFEIPLLPSFLSTPTRYPIHRSR